MGKHEDACAACAKRRKIPPSKGKEGEGANPEDSEKGDVGQATWGPGTQEPLGGWRRTPDDGLFLNFEFLYGGYCLTQAHTNTCIYQTVRSETFYCIMHGAECVFLADVDDPSGWIPDPGDSKNALEPPGAIPKGSQGDAPGVTTNAAMFKNLQDWHQVVAETLGASKAWIRVTRCVDLHWYVIRLDDCKVLVDTKMHGIVNYALDPKSGQPSAAPVTQNMGGGHGQKPVVGGSHFGPGYYSGKHPRECSKPSRPTMGKTRVRAEKPPKKGGGKR